MEFEDTFDEIGNKLSEIDFSEKQNETLSDVDSCRIWESPYGVVAAAVVEDPHDVESIQKSWVSGQYWLDQRLSKLERSRVYKDGFLFLIMPEEPATDEAKQKVLDVKYDVTVCQKQFIQPGKTDWSDVGLIGGLDFDRTTVGDGPTPETIKSGNVEIPLDTQVVLVEGHNNTDRERVDSALERDLKNTKSVFFTRPFEGMDDKERIDWIYRFRTTVLRNPDIQVIITTPLSQPRQFLQQSFLHIEGDTKSEEGQQNTPLRATLLKAGLSGPEILKTASQVYVEPTEMSGMNAGGPISEEAFRDQLQQAKQQQKKQNGQSGGADQLVPDHLKN